MIVDPVSEDDVFERLRRALQPKGLLLQRGTLDGAAGDERGRFYTTAPDGHTVHDLNVDLDRWARREGVLQPNETMVPSHGEVRERD